MTKGKYYVVWAGYQPGIYDTWEECKAQIDGFSGARYRAFDTCEEATEAFRREMDVQEMQFYTFLTKQKAQAINFDAFPEIRLDAIAVDGACDKNPGGKIEYQGVRVGTGERIFHLGPLEGGSNNLAEYLGLVHALALLQQQGDNTTPVYSDSRTAISWVRKRHNRSTLQLAPDSKLAQILARADRWVATHTWQNPIIKWETEKWGEIPADFGRK
ncbi:MAG: ribonuclease H family protein [Bacteroidales bacterium]|nr:ribonuclease H family protein [Bacteroidales bacterium]